MNTESGLNFDRKVYFAKILFMACRKLIRTCDLFDDDLFDLRGKCVLCILCLKINPRYLHFLPLNCCNIIILVFNKSTEDRNAHSL